MKKNPPVLSDRKAVVHLETGETIDIPLYEYLKAQRDADVEWYEKRELDYFKQWQQAAKDSRAGKDIDLNEAEFEIFCSIQNDAFSKGYKQARQETAREIFEEANSRCIHGGEMIIKRDCDDCWKEIESKYLEGK